MPINTEDNKWNKSLSLKKSMLAAASARTPDGAHTQRPMAQVGDVIAVISGDEGSKKDIPAWVAKAGQEFLGTEPALGATRFIMKKIK